MFAALFEPHGVVAPEALHEFTCMLCFGPPMICTFELCPPPPWISKDFGSVGCRTRMGMGAVSTFTPHTANARTVCTVFPLRKPVKNVRILSFTSTRINGWGAMDAEGVGTPGGALTKLTYTLFPW